MKTEQEIVLQKKMIIIFSLVILLFTMGILNIHKSTVLAVSKNLQNETVVTVRTSYIANEELFKIEVSGEETKEENISGENIIVENQTVEVIEEVQSNNEVVENVESIENEVATPVASRGSYVRETNVPPTEYESVITVKATAYCLCKKCCGKSPSSPGYGHTASGLVIVPGTDMKVISVDPNVIPLGTEVYVDGYGYAIAADTGGAIKNNKIDVYKDTHAAALAWGVKTVNVYILKTEEN